MYWSFSVLHILDCTTQKIENMTHHYFSRTASYLLGVVATMYWNSLSPCLIVWPILVRANCSRNRHVSADQISFSVGKWCAWWLGIRIHLDKLDTPLLTKLPLVAAGFTCCFLSLSGPDPYSYELCQEFYVVGGVGCPSVDSPRSVSARNHASTSLLMF